MRVVASIELMADGEHCGEERKQRRHAEDRPVEDATRQRLCVCHHH
jgi:hypothetical protein